MHFRHVWLLRHRKRLLAIFGSVRVKAKMSQKSKILVGTARASLSDDRWGQDAYRASQPMTGQI